MWLNKEIMWILGIHLITRTTFAFCIGFYNNYALQPDSLWLTNFGLQATQFDFNFELKRFISSPLYPMVVAVFRVFFGQFWNTALIIFQLLLSSLSGLTIYHIGIHIFKKSRPALLGSLLYAFYPFTLWYTNTFSQECLFQSLLIFSIYYLIVSISSHKIKHVFYSAILFSLAYLTKSHILLFSIFIPLVYLLCTSVWRTAIAYSFLYGSISLLLSLPYGLYQLHVNDTYVISSNGAGYQFYLGNTDVGYITTVSPPTKGTSDYKKIKNINVTAGYFNGDQSKYDSLMNLPQSIKQGLFFKEGLKWISENRSKFFELKAYDLVLFLKPGVNKNFYSWPLYILSLTISFPVFLLAYIGIGLNIKRKETFPILCLFVAMVLFSTVWYVQNRFRAITIEPYYLIYAGYTIHTVAKKIPILNRLIDYLEQKIITPKNPTY